MWLPLLRTLPFAALLAAFLVLPGQAPSRAEEPSPFDKLAGRWVGEGRFGIRDGSTEAVKCRVTYIITGDGNDLKQSIRCASAGGNVEIHSAVAHKAGTIAGTWKELVRDMSGEVTGTVTSRGFRVAVRGESLNANMDIVLVNSKQVIEIQFIDSSLIGLTLILDKADAPLRKAS
ncbi:MAG TPA: hypothetical protein VFR73_17830 [Hyphomicrobiaceae bacterium]|nr:hypothetical protein [Hyphomicrobiaceae bacterium]